MYKAGDYDLAGFAVGAVERGEILPRQDIAIGDVLIGLPSSGVHSNGYSLVRKLVEREGVKWESPAPFGKKKSIAEALLEPTRIYVKPLLAAIRATGGSGAKGAIKALSHITGGGLAENIPRVMPDHAAARIDLSSWKMPAVFGWLAKAGGLDDREMLRTFNCGIGMVIVADKKRAKAVIAALQDAGEKPHRHRRCHRADGRKERSERQGRSQRREIRRQAQDLKGPGT